MWETGGVLLQCETNVSEVIPIDLSVTKIDCGAQAYYTMWIGNTDGFVFVFSFHMVETTLIFDWFVH